MRPLQTTGLQKHQASRLLCESLEARHPRCQAVQRLAGRPNEQQLQQCRAFKRSFQSSQTAERPQEKAHDVEVLDDATMTPQIGESLHQSGDAGQQPVDAYDGFPEDEAPPPYPPIEHGDDLQAGKGGIDLFEAGPAFMHIEMDGCDALVRAEMDGRLDLQTVFFHDHELDIFAEPERIGEIPQVPDYYAPSEWREEFMGDTLMEKDPWSKIHKVYLLKIADSNPDHFRFDLETVFCLDAQTRTLKKEVVERKTTETNLQNLTLRIRPEGCTIEENSEIISDFDLVEDYIRDQDAEKIRKAEESGWSRTGWIGGAEEGAATGSAEAGSTDDGETMGPRDPIDALNDDEREYDENFEDTPEVDQGY